MKLSLATSVEINAVFQDAATIRGQSTVEGIAQKFTELLFKRFQDSLIVTRIFATIPMGKLPKFNRDFVDSLAASAAVSEQVNDETMVLSLLGTSGRLPEWNERRKSKGHVGIPLVSGKFVGSIPMISRLLTEIGMELDWVSDWGTKIVSKGFLSQSTGMFYVDDAGTSKDQEGRNIIVDQNFVSLYGVKTVFGFGIGFVGNPTLAVLIAFAKETLGQPLIRSFIPVMAGFKRAAMDDVLNGNFFA